MITKLIYWGVYMEENKKDFVAELIVGVKYAINELMEEKDSVTYRYLVEITKRKKNAVELFDNVAYVEEAVICELLKRVYDNLFDSEKLSKIYPDNDRIIKLQNSFIYLRKKFEKVADCWHPSIPLTLFNDFVKSMMLICNNTQEKIDNFATVNKRLGDVGRYSFIENFYYYSKFYEVAQEFMGNFDLYVSLTDEELCAKVEEFMDEDFYFDGYFDVVDNGAYEWFLHVCANGNDADFDYDYYYVGSGVSSEMKCLFEDDSLVSDGEINDNKVLVKRRIMKKLEN